MTEQELEEFIGLGHELPGVEFKPPGPRTDLYLLATVTRAVLGMANRAGGGLVIVGVEEAAGGTLQPKGLSQGDLQTWDFDSMMAGFAAAADPFVVVERDPSPFKGATLLVIRVHEFETVPVICRKQFTDDQGKPILRQGAVYVRTRRKPETSAIPSQTEMRDLLDLATNKALRSFIARGAAGGIDLKAPPTDDQQFDEQLGDLK
jgi:hypothetical protein